MINPDHYTYRVTWSEEDGEYVGLCAEYPSLSHLAPNRGEALEGISVLVSEVVGDLFANGEPIPEPLSERHFSGKFMVRVPPELHRSLVTRAAEEGVSLNRYVSARLVG